MSGRSEEGLALIAVLWALTLLSLVAAALSFESRRGAHIAHNMVDNAVARAAADAGIRRAILDLVSTAPNGSKEANGDAYEWQFANSRIRIFIWNELTKLDLNTASESLLTHLFSSVGVDLAKAKTLADAIADFRDRDSLKRPRGAEDADYRAVGLTWGPKNAAFQGIEELQQVLGMTPEIYQKVAPHVTIYSIADTEDFYSSPKRAYSIRAEASGPKGANSVRTAIIQLGGVPSIEILEWR